MINYFYVKSFFVIISTMVHTILQYLCILSLEEDVDSNISSTSIVERCGLEEGRRLSKGCHYLN